MLTNPRNRRFIHVIGKGARDWAGASNPAWTIVPHENAEAARRGLESSWPSLIAFDLDDCTCGGRCSIPERLSDQIPHIGISACETFQLRLELARAGFASLLRPGDGPRALLELAERVANPADDEPFRVLIGASSPTLGKAAGALLGLAGATPKVVSRPEQVLDWLGKMSPDVLVLESMMGGIAAAELIAIIRQEERHSGLSVMVIDAGRMPYQLDFPPPNVEIYTGGLEYARFVQAITSRAAYSRQLARLLYADGMTGLLAHRGIRSRLDAEMARAKREDSPLSFALLDLDHFKQVNDTYGHLAGDVVIRAFAGVLSRRVRAMDIAGRYGGEEFAIIFPSTPVAAAVAVVESVREEFGAVWHSSEDATFQVTVSAGVAGLRSGDKPESLIGMADLALYRAKEAGRNRVLSTELGGG